MLAGYCAGWSLRQLLWEGFNGVSNKVEAAPPKHLRTALVQMVNFLGTLQNEWAGAQAFSSVDTYLAPFIRNDWLGYDEVRQCFQEFIYNLNVPSRWRGHLTLEFSNSSAADCRVYAKEGAVQMIFFQWEPCQTSYRTRQGKYQQQPQRITLPRV